MDGRTAARTGLTLALGTAGALAFALVSAPAAFLTGSAVAVAVAVLGGVRTHLPAPLRLASFSVLGIMMGAGITPEALRALAGLPVALGGLFAVIAGATAAGYLVLRRVGGWDRVTALCGAIPGNLSLVLVTALDSGAAMERVVIAQAMRLLILVTAVPFVFGGADAATLRVPAAPDATAADVAVTLAVAFGAAAVAGRLRLPAATMVGPLLAGTALSAAGLMTIAVPDWLAAATLVLLGVSVGTRFETLRREGLGRILAAAFGSFLAAVAVAVAVSVTMAPLLGEPLGEVFLAYAPGGLDAMVALSFLLGYDVALVAVLHAARMIVLAVGIPWVARWAAGHPAPP